MSFLCSGIPRAIRYNNDQYLDLGSDADLNSCVPYVSEYTDCTEANQCTGCNRCSCDGDSKWSCRTVHECPSQEYTPVNDKTLDSVLNDLYSELKNRNSNKQVKAPQSQLPNEELVLEQDEDVEQKIIALISRKKRALNEKNNTSVTENGTVQFYNTRDDINKDTLKHVNTSGTIEATKVLAVPVPPSRRSGVLHNSDLTSDSPLQIQYNKPLAHHITDNKIDTTAHTEEKDYNLGEIFGIVTNHTQKDKDRNLSKIIVNELKIGKEIIGDNDAPVISNITFTPENDTLTAMAFIAGNLLNKLWSMEKDSSQESMETEAMKHEKISDLLDLFKEPLTMRQENFLKGALEKLSDAMEKKKDIANVSLCKDLEETQKFLRDSVNSSWELTEIKKPQKNIRKISDDKEETIKADEKQRNVTAEAIDKINNVLSLIKKFEGVNKNLNDVKRTPKNDLKEIISKPIIRNNDNTDSKVLSDNENSVNIFGHVLEKITKLLLPNKRSKKIVKSIREQNIFASSTDDIKQKVKKMFNIDVSDTKLTAKDKLVLDYLTQLQNNHKCILGETSNHYVQTPSIEGDIMLNFSEFLKIKSFMDLMKLIQPEQQQQQQQQNLRTQTTVATEKSIYTTTEMYTSISLEETKDTKLRNTKKKFKSHLKTILEDLIELQKESGIVTKQGDLRIAEALPCIYNILKSELGITNKNTFTSMDNIADLFETLKKNQKLASNMTNMRRKNVNNTITEERPKSAIVMERIVKNFGAAQRRLSRRNFDVEPKTLEEVNGMLEVVGSLVSNSYKNIALHGVAAPEKLTLLKALHLDAEQYIEVLHNLKASLVSVESLPSDKMNAFNSFVKNADLNTKLSNHVITSLKKPKKRKTHMNSSNFNAKKLITQHKEEMKLPRIKSLKDTKIELSREDILNQLIRNRVTMFLKLKESSGNNSDYDPGYNLAKNILLNLERGNSRLAGELYKLFVTTKDNSGNDKRAVTPSTKKLMKKQTILEKEPLIEFEEPKPSSQKKRLTQEQLIKQLLSMQKIRP